MRTPQHSHHISVNLSSLLPLQQTPLKQVTKAEDPIATMSDINLPLRQQLQTAPAPTNGTTAAENKRQAHPNTFPCIECPAHFPNAVDRATHLHTAHNIENGFLCQECASSCSDPARSARHANDHARTRFNPPPTLCDFFTCDYRHCSTELTQLHYKEDHVRDGSHQAQCPKCEYSNDSIVGVSVHLLHVHSVEGKANRKAALERRRETELLAAREAAIEAARANPDSSSTETGESKGDSSSLAVKPASKKRSRKTADKDDEEAGDGSSPTPAEPTASKRPRLTRQEQELANANAANSNAFLEAQMAAYNGLNEDEHKQAFLSHKERKRFKMRDKKLKKATPSAAGPA